MRVAIALAAIALSALFALTQGAAMAQGMGMGQGNGRGRHQAATLKPGDKTTKADEKAYRDALKRIPDKKVDPWGNMR
jgi:hypothetical protein